MKHIVGIFGAALALMSAVCAEEINTELNVEKRDNCGQPIMLQAASAPCQQPQFQVQAATPPPCQPQVQVQAAAPPPCQQPQFQIQAPASSPCQQPQFQVQAAPPPCQQPQFQVQAAPPPCQQPQIQVQAVAAPPPPPCQPQFQVQAAAPPPCQPQLQVVQPCQQQSVQPIMVQASQPCAQPIAIQEQYSPPPVLYQQPLYQQQPAYQPIYQLPQPMYYPPPPPYDDEPGNPCYSQFGAGLAGASGRFLRYLMCPWSYFGDCWDQDDNSNNGGGYPYYPPNAPQYVPQYVPQPAPQPQQPQQPQGQWYYNVVPVQNPQSAVLQPVHSSLVPDYGLPNGYGTTTNIIPCN